MATFLLPFIRSKNKLKFFLFGHYISAHILALPEENFQTKARRVQYTSARAQNTPSQRPSHYHVKRFRARKRNSTKFLGESKKQHKTSIFDCIQHTTPRWWIWGKNIWSITGKAKTKKKQNLCFGNVSLLHRGGCLTWKSDWPSHYACILSKDNIK